MRILKFLGVLGIFMTIVNNPLMAKTVSNHEEFSNCLKDDNLDSCEFSSVFHGELSKKTFGLLQSVSIDYQINRRELLDDILEIFNDDLNFTLGPKTLLVKFNLYGQRTVQAEINFHIAGRIEGDVCKFKVFPVSAKIDRIFSPDLAALTPALVSYGNKELEKTKEDLKMVLEKALYHLQKNYCH